MEVSLHDGQGPKKPVSGNKNRQEIEEIQKITPRTEKSKQNEQIYNLRWQVTVG